MNIAVEAELMARLAKQRLMLLPHVIISDPTLSAPLSASDVGELADRNFSSVRACHFLRF
ncbi:hypothetical protein D9M68_819190 [compost metagenome]